LAYFDVQFRILGPSTPGNPVQNTILLHSVCGKVQWYIKSKRLAYNLHKYEGKCILTDTNNRLLQEKEWLWL